MSPEFQTIAALGIVALAASWLILRTFARRKSPGCGGECACPAEKLKR